MQIDRASLATYRALFGVIALIGVVRFFAYGWIDEFYVEPTFHFGYYGFEWIKPWPKGWMHAHFALMGVAASFVALGIAYRAAIACYFVLFTYVELIDKTYYLNHYYLVSVLALLMAFMPLGRRNGRETAPAWCLTTLRLQVGLVYFFAGVAKLKPDWLFEAEPLATWLRAYGAVPLVGPMLDEKWVAYAASWGAAAFDLVVPFLLAWRRTRKCAFLAIVVFHSVTGLMFQLGLFPLIMVANATLFFDPSWPRRVFPWFTARPTTHSISRPFTLPRPALWALCIHFLLQLVLPLRHWIYPGDVTWTEEGFRFAWNVMLVEKAGQVRFNVREPQTGREWEILPESFLNVRQCKMMATQPDMILQAAKHVARDFGDRGIYEVEVRADAHVALSGRRSRQLIDPSADLARLEDGLSSKSWIVQ